MCSTNEIVAVTQSLKLITNRLSIARCLSTCVSRAISDFLKLLKFKELRPKLEEASRSFLQGIDVLMYNYVMQSEVDVIT